MPELVTFLSDAEVHPEKESPEPSFFGATASGAKADAYYQPSLERLSGKLSGASSRGVNPNNMVFHPIGLDLPNVWWVRKETSYLEARQGAREDSPIGFILRIFCAGVKRIGRNSCPIVCASSHKDSPSIRRRPVGVEG